MLLLGAFFTLFSGLAYGTNSSDVIYVFGHKSPDTDTISGAISAAYLYKQRGFNTVAVAQGKPNPETRFLLKKFKMKAPEVIGKLNGHRFILVDFSDVALAPEDFNPANLVGIIDHHKLGDVTSESPLECYIKPLGSANTIIKQLYDYYNVKIPEPIAGMMLGAILSDTMIFKSPTTTQEDIKAAKELATIAGITDIEALGREQQIAKSDLKAPASELLMRDFKNFDINHHKVGIGQLELLEIKSVDETLKAKLLKEMEKLKSKQNYHTLLLSITCPDEGGSAILVRSDAREHILQSFNAPNDDSLTIVKGILSRKKDLVPILYKALP
ncbi:MAG TPA: manganese-dependent inorganic pyrophosphatase [Sutterella sp.]|nr:manganese-dependent inorganic pyrophosphatase [Sutterella sp.]